MSEEAPDEKELIRQVMGIIGSRTSEAKKISSRENARKPRPNRKPKPLLEIPCTCKGGDTLTAEAHPTTCPRGRAIRRRIKDNLPLE